MQDFTRNWSVWRSCARTQSLERWITTLTGLGWPDTLRPPSAPAVRAKVCCGASTRSYGRSLALRTTLASFLTAPFTGSHHWFFLAPDASLSKSPGSRWSRRRSWVWNGSGSAWSSSPSGGTPSPWTCRHQPQSHKAGSVQRGQIHVLCLRQGDRFLPRQLRL